MAQLLGTSMAGYVASRFCTCRLQLLVPAHAYDQCLHAQGAASLALRDSSPAYKTDCAGAAFQQVAKSITLVYTSSTSAACA